MPVKSFVFINIIIAIIIITIIIIIIIDIINIQVSTPWNIIKMKYTQILQRRI